MEKKRAGREILPIDKELARILSQEIQKSGMSQLELSERSSVSQPAISRLLKAQRPVYVNVLESICEALGLTAWKVMKQAEEAVRERENVNEGLAKFDTYMTSRGGYDFATKRHPVDPYAGLGEESRDV